LNLCDADVMIIHFLLHQHHIGSSNELSLH
jgi:hypothetical protein